MRWREAAGARVLAASALALSACSTGDGAGFVRSDQLTIEGCWNGPFDMVPTFFATNPFRDSQLIRIQRGDEIEEVSDGLAVLVDGVTEIRRAQLGLALEVGLPRGVSPPGVPVTADSTPAPVSLALYLNDSCHASNSAVYSVSGSITFTALFSGDPNEATARDRLTAASFTATFVDPRRQDPAGGLDLVASSQVEGAFRFYFQRGQPAQPFP